MNRLVKLIAFCCLLLAAPATFAGQRLKIAVPSSIDATEQPSYLILPNEYDPQGKATPLLVALHSWSGDVEQRQPELEAAAEKQGWLYLFPNFRGRNDDPEACGSKLAQQDILDAVRWVCRRYPVDRARIYLTGSSGGGHMTMLMAARHPQVWAAASAWVGISDLSAWHQRHADDNYGQMLRACCGGRPGDSSQVDKEYRDRSPLTHLAGAVDVPLDLAAGVHDGHQGSVPIRHTLEAFNVVAKAAGGESISEAEIVQLSRPMGKLEQPSATDTAQDPAFGRAIYLRRTAGKARVTIFEGGHEGLPEAAVAWLARYRKPNVAP
jgi:poly(3-hydroxybutyrate) depolymerase